MTYDEYLEVKECKYSETFPSMNSNDLLTICKKDIDCEYFPKSYEYIHHCPECTGKDCENMEKRQNY